MLNTLTVLLLVMLMGNVNFAQEITKPTALEVKPFLYLPFDKSDRNLLKISEGFVYSNEEKKIHGFTVHYGIDFDALEGTKVYAPCDGLAQRGFHTSLVRDPKNAEQFLLYENQTIGFGLGHFIQLWCEKQELYVMLAHMKEVSNKIPSVPFQIKNNFEYSPDVYYQFPIIKHTKRVKRGDFLGSVGHTGLGQFYPNLNGKIDEYELPDKATAFSWDSDHLHMEVYRRNEKGIKISSQRWDPFGWYADAENAPYKKFQQSADGLFVTDKSKNIKFAK